MVGRRTGGDLQPTSPVRLRIMDDDEAAVLCWVCGRGLDPDEPRRLAQIPAPDPSYPLAFREALVCVDCAALGDLDRVCPASGAEAPLRDDDVRLLVRRLPS
jgi:hypothetical protein